MHRLTFSFVALCVGLHAAVSVPLTLTERDETISTYLSGPAGSNPMFYFGRQSRRAREQAKARAELADRPDHISAKLVLGQLAP